MLIEQIVELQWRGPGPPGLTCTSITGYFHDKTKICKENLPVGFHLLLKCCRSQSNFMFAVFDDVNACSSFLNILNSQHDNIKFTIEKSTNTLQFLDVDIKISENTADTWVWRKPTNTGYSLTLLLYVPLNGNLV